MKTKKGQSKFISDRFIELYNEKWRSQGRTQKEFTEAIKAVDPCCGINQEYMSRLMHGTYTPGPKYLADICMVLDVDISEFYPKTHDDRYQYSSEFADGLEAKLEEFAEKYFKIDLTFFQGLRNIIPDFDKKFPIYTPLVWYDIHSQHKPYERAVAVEAATTTSRGQGLFQVMRDDLNGSSEENDKSCYFLSRLDMKFIREIQDEISRLVQQKFIARREALKAAEEEVNEEFWKKLMEYNPYYDDDQTVYMGFRFSEEELQSLDRAGIYSEKEAKRLRLPHDWRDRLTTDGKEVNPDE